MAIERKGLADYNQKIITFKEKEGNNNCYYCNIYVYGSDKTLDHKTPLSRGGEHEEHNFAIACVRCNSLKGDMTEEEFMQLFKHGIRCRTPNTEHSYWHDEENKKLDADAVEQKRQLNLLRKKEIRQKEIYDLLLKQEIRMEAFAKKDSNTMYITKEGVIYRKK